MGFPLKHGKYVTVFAGWWFQSIRKILVKLEMVPKVGVNKKKMETTTRKYTQKNHYLISNHV